MRTLALLFITLLSYGCASRLPRETAVYIDGALVTDPLAKEYVLRIEQAAVSMADNLDRVTAAAARELISADDLDDAIQYAKDVRTALAAASLQVKAYAQSPMPSDTRTYVDARLRKATMLLSIISAMAHSLVPRIGTLEVSIEGGAL